MTIGEIALLVGLLINAAAILLSVRRSREASDKIDRVASDLTVVKIQSDGMHEALVKSHGIAEHSKGLQQGRDEGVTRATALADGQRQERDAASARVVPKSLIDNGNKPLPVADDRTATASERVADASERVANATEERTDLMKK